MVKYSEVLYPRERARKDHAQKEELPSSCQTHHASRNHPLSAMPDEITTVCHDFRSHHCDPQASHSTRPLWLSMSTPRLSRQKNALSKCTSRCVGVSRVYLWLGYRPARRTSPTERAPNGR